MPGKPAWGGSCEEIGREEIESDEVLPERHRRLCGGQAGQLRMRDTCEAAVAVAEPADGLFFAGAKG